MINKGEHVLTVTETGNVRGLYTDAIDLTAIGTVKVSRASNVEFDADSQRWQVIINKKVMFSHKSRETCLEWERIYFNLKELMG